jgi:hypothetical protein
MDALPAAETPDLWYLISEQELQSIEQYKATSEAERQALLQRAQRLQSSYESLALQYRQAREAQRRSDALYEQSEAARLTLLSSKNGEIAGLIESLSKEKLATQKSYRQRDIAWAIIGLVAAIALISLYQKIKYGRVLFPP